MPSLAQAILANRKRHGAIKARNEEYAARQKVILDLADSDAISWDEMCRRLDALRKEFAQ
jgi:hypothetical protein